jgi:thiaminase/transcriptional activator TenA
MSYGGLFESLKTSALPQWQAYVDHDFVRQLGTGTLPEACFRHYLIQDYIFLIHFSRAYALAAFKSDDLEEMGAAAATLDALINGEMKLHLEYCRKWGLSEAEMAATPEAPANMAYTRFVLERGLSGDLLDLLVALAPCVVGYGEIGIRLAAESAGAGNPYQDWVDTYAGEDYQEVVKAALEQLDRVALKRLGSSFQDSPRVESLRQTFRAATELEIGFWEMGLNPPANP